MTRTDRSFSGESGKGDAPELILPFLKAFGVGTGLGNYPRVEVAMMRYDSSDVVPHLATLLSEGVPSGKFWTAQIASAFPDPALVAPLASIVHGDDDESRSMAIVALEQIGGDDALDVLRSRLEAEDDPELITLLVETIRDMSKGK